MTLLHLRVAVYIGHLQGGVLCFVYRASRYKCVKKNQIDAQHILSTFRQPLHVSGTYRYNCMYTTVGTYYSC
jgi:hypothetical protein